MLKPRHSTNPSGTLQPGAFEIKYISQAKETRKVEQGNTIKTYHNKVLHDIKLECYRIVGEVKSTTDNAESQNVEQMIGLWRYNQIAMLGFTCNPKGFIPRVLVRVEDTMYLLPLLPVKDEDPATMSSLRDIAEMFVAFLSFVF